MNELALSTARSVIVINEYMHEDGSLFVTYPLFRNNDNLVLNRILAQPSAYLALHGCDDTEFKNIVECIYLTQCWTLDDYRNITGLAMGKKFQNWHSFLPIPTSKLPVEYVKNEVLTDSLSDYLLDVGLITDQVKVQHERLDISPKITVQKSSLSKYDYPLFSQLSSDTVTDNERFKDARDLLLKFDEHFLNDSALENNPVDSSQGIATFIVNPHVMDESTFKPTDFQEYRQYVVIDGYIAAQFDTRSNPVQSMFGYKLGYSFIDDQDASADQFRKAFNVSLREVDLANFLLNATQVTGFSFH